MWTWFPSFLRARRRPSAWGRSCLWPTAALVVMWSALASMTQAATLEVYGPLAAKQVVQLRGPIGPSDASRLAGLIKIAVENGHLVPSLVRIRLGGTFGGSVGLAQVVRTFELSTYVEDGAQCAPACFLVFAAGKKKFASYGARIGVHAVKDSKGDADRAAAGTEAMRRLLTALAVPLSITKRMADTPNDKMAWLSIPELRLMGVSVLGRSEPSPLEVALPTPAAPGKGRCRT